jgi:hypothetical protein
VSSSTRARSSFRSFDGDKRVHHLFLSDDLVTAPAYNYLLSVRRKKRERDHDHRFVVNERPALRLIASLSGNSEISYSALLQHLTIR